MTSIIGPRNSAFGPGARRLTRRRASGFTLMELVLVLVVISVVLALSAPSLRGFFASRQTADAAVRMLALTKWARSEAVSRGCLCRLNFDPAAGAFWLTVQSGGQFIPADRDLGRRFQLPEGAEVVLRSDSADPTAPYLQFYPNGRSDVATIEIRGRQGDVYQIVAPSATEPFRVVTPSEAGE